MAVRLAAVSDHRARAARLLPRFAFEYLENGAEDERTLHRNLRAYERVDFAPDVLVDVSNIDTSTSLFGQTLAFPAAVGPTGLNGLYRHRAEEQLARAAGRARVPFVLSTASTSDIAEVRAAATGVLWLQLYVHNDRRIAERLMQRAQELQFSVLLLTVDTPVAGRRDHYRRNGFTLPLRWTPKLLWDIVTHPRWCLRTGIHGMPQMVNLAASANEPARLLDQATLMSQQMDRRLAWGDLAWVRAHWKGPVLVKGICTLADAKRALSHGADGIVLSNHGGRQLEGAPSALEVLPEVVDAVGERMPVLVDGGIRRGADIAKARALGAAAVLLGRAPLYGLAAHGESGVDDVLAILRAELETTLRLLGQPLLSALDRTALRANWSERLATV